MRPLALLLLLASCRGADARPDYFGVEVGSGWSDESGMVGARDFDASGNGQWAALHLGWNLSEQVPARRAEPEWHYPPTAPQAAPAPAPEPEAAPTPEPKPELTPEPVPPPDDAAPPEESDGLPLVPALATVAGTAAALTLAWFNREALKVVGRAIQRAALAWVRRAE